MIPLDAYKETDFIENAIQLMQEKDFLAYAAKGKDKPYLFVYKEFHPDEKKDQIIAHHLYVLDVSTRHVFGYMNLLIPEAEYDKLTEE